MRDQPIHPDLDALLPALLDGSLDTAGRDRLRELVRTDPAARRQYLEYLTTHVVLQWRHGQMPALRLPALNSQLGTRNAERSSPLPPGERPGVRAGDPVRSAHHVPRSAFRVPNFAYALAAALLLAACGVAIVLISLNSKPETRNPKPAAHPIATVIDATDGVSVDGGLAQPGADYGPGPYSIESGEAEFLLLSRVSVQLRGKSRLVLHDPMRATLDHGSAGFTCPPQAKGFTVHLPDGSKIVDLGTAFRVEIDQEGRAKVRVTEGVVEWTAADPGSQPVRIGEGAVAHMIYSRVVVDPNPGLVAYWPLNDGPAGSTVTGADDRIDDPDHPAADATVEGDGETWVHDPDRGVVLSTTATGNLIAGTQGITGDFTWSLWIKTTHRGAAVIIGNRSGSMAAPFNKLTTSGLGTWASIPAPGGDLGVSDGRWHHVAIRRSHSDVRVFVDGKPIGPSVRVTTPTNGPLRIGGDPIFNERIAALLSDVAVWNAALSDERIKALANGAAVMSANALDAPRDQAIPHSDKHKPDLDRR